MKDPILMAIVFKYFFRAGAILALLLTLISVQMAGPGRAAARDSLPRNSLPRNSLPRNSLPRNSWRGITPLRSSAADVARLLEMDADRPDAMLDGPFPVEGGEVTFSYLSPSLAKIYRAPRSMVGKVFTIYFKPGDRISHDELKLTRDFKRCVERWTKSSYYLVSAAGIAYQLRRADDSVETIIYQPSSGEVRRLAVNTECVF